MAYSTVKPTGAIGPSWPQSHNLPQGKEGKISAAGWSDGNEGFAQQTFLGASIRSFDASAGFGNTSSSLSVALVNDEYNKSDLLGYGNGDDVYHNGTNDEFRPPNAGAPVFFKFGKNLATVEEAWKKTFDDIYGTSTVSPPTFPSYTVSSPLSYLPDNHIVLSDDGSTVTIENRESLATSPINPNRGYYHFCFGGILQSYEQNRGGGGNPLYDVSVNDPREILSNASFILKNYNGTTYDNKNLFNLYGFLECEISNSLRATLDSASISKSILTKNVDTAGNVTYTGNDSYKFTPPIIDITRQPESFPITGIGMSRASDRGLPLYRIVQSINALFELGGKLPDEYVAKGFGGALDFRGYKYVVDFTGIPVEKIPNMYFMNFDQIDILSFVQELCDIISHDFYVTLLPVINHPNCEWIKARNDYYISTGENSKVITGIIRIETIDKSKQQSHGSVKQYIDSLTNAGVHVENQNVGFESTNETTDKFVVGGQEVEMYYFTDNKDRDFLERRKQKAGMPNESERLLRDQWKLSTMLKQEIVPFYGFLGKDAVTIPKGFGSYQQILLDSSDLQAFGVGNYYVATEMELRAATVSYERWRDFLLMYTETYLQEMTDNLFYCSVAGGGSLPGDAAWGAPEFIPKNFTSRKFGVTVPRCVWNSDKPFMGEDGYPASPCSPPYGYPLYYKRAEKIGIPEAGLASMQSYFTSIITGEVKLKENLDKARAYMLVLKQKDWATMSRAEQQEVADLNTQIRNLTAEHISVAAFNISPAAAKMAKLMPVLAREYLKNAKKVYEFVKGVADKHLGKTFLIKVPRKINEDYQAKITIKGNNLNVMEYKKGPFGFRSRPTNVNQSSVSADVKEKEGALQFGFNPVKESWDFNYRPAPDGGFFNYALYNKNLNFTESTGLSSSKLPLATQQFLAPQDLTNFVSNSNRISCYVRFNNSELLDFRNISKGSITQSYFTSKGFVPDVMEELDNLEPKDIEYLEQVNGFNAHRANVAKKKNNPTAPESLPRPDSVAFVKCDLDDKLYLAPRVVKKNKKVFGTAVTYISNNGDSRTVDKDDPATLGRDEVPAIQEALPLFKPSDDGAEGGGYDGLNASVEDFDRYFDKSLVGDVVKSQDYLLSSDHAYALITLPGRVFPSVDRRYMDGPAQAFNAPKLKNLLTADVVKGLPEFQNPPALTYRPIPIKGIRRFSSADAENQAWQQQKKYLQGLAIELPEGSLTFTSPSPVYPSMVALPLMSEERCYGPWLSASVQNYTGSTQVRYSNIGGKIEFVKEEELAPWNYGGYQLMNEAGALKAQFSNSLLLISERGSFTLPGSPGGISLAGTLTQGGPLVTSISVSISDSVKTTVNLDLYTARFGKLQKHKEDEIGQLVRQRQKIIDLTNNLTRNSVLTSQKGVFPGGLGVKDKQVYLGLQQGSNDINSALEQSHTVYNNFVVHARRKDQELRKLGSINDDVTLKTIEYGGAVLSPGYLEEAMSHTDNPEVVYQAMAGGYMPLQGYSEIPNNDGFFPSNNYRYSQEVNNRVYNAFGKD